MTLKTLILFSLLSSCALYAQEPQFYVGSKAGWASAHNACEPHRLKCENNEIGAGIYAGVGINKETSIEVGYDYFGKMKAIYPSLADEKIHAPYHGKVQGISAAVKYDFLQLDNVAFFAKAGGLAWRADVKGQEVDFQHRTHDTGFSPLLGTGLEYTFTDNWKGRFEYQWMNEVGGGNTGGSSLNTLYLGASYRW